MTLQIVSDGVTRDFTMTTAFVQYGTVVEAAGLPVDFNWISADTLQLTQAPALGAIITITPNTSGVITGNTSGGISQEALDNSLGNLEASLGAQLGTAGAVSGELRVFNTTTAPAGWTEKDRNGAPPLAITYGRRDIQCSPRAYTAGTGDMQSATVAGEYRGFVYYVYTLSGGASSSVHVEKMDITTGKTSYVTYSALNNYSSAAGTFCASSAIVGNTLFLFGGRTYNNTAQTTTYKLNLDNVAAGWSTTDSMSNVNPAHGMGVAVTGDKIYAVGGVTGDQTSAATSNHVRVFNAATSTWYKLAAVLPFGSLENVQTVALENGNILCAGGWTGSVEVKKYAVLNTTTGQFGPVYDLPANWSDRPRAIMRSPGHSIVRGFCFTDNVKCTVVEFDGTSWIDTGRAAVFNNCVMGNLGLSDGSSFSPATLTSYKVPHVQHMHPTGSSGRMLCAKV